MAYICKSCAPYNLKIVLLIILTTLLSVTDNVIIVSILKIVWQILYMLIGKWHVFHVWLSITEHYKKWIFPVVQIFVFKYDKPFTK